MSQKITVLEVLVTLTTAREITELLLTDARRDPGVSDGFEDMHALGYLAEYVAMLHREAIVSPDVVPTDGDLLEVIDAEQRENEPYDSPRCRVLSPKGRRCVRDKGHCGRHDFQFDAAQQPDELFPGTRSALDDLDPFKEELMHPGDNVDCK